MRVRRQFPRLDDHLANLAFKRVEPCVDKNVFNKLSRKLQDSKESDLAYEFRCLVEEGLDDENSD
jgi:hypothetical protein